MKGLCADCERRAWLLETLGVRLEFRARELDCLWSLLELSDSDLIDAVGGRRRDELREAYARWQSARQPSRSPIERICRHHPAYPSCLRGDSLAPATLGVRGGLDRLGASLERDVVAVVGTRRASDYGMELARKLARELAACGLTVAGGVGEGIASAVQGGVLEAGAMPLGVMGAGLEACSPACLQPLYRRVLEHGCAISEQALPARARPRGWWRVAGDRVLALLCQLTIVVEAGEHPRELACARVAWTRGKCVAAVPGRVTSEASRGTNALLMNGARMVRCAEDALEALYGMDGSRLERREGLSAGEQPALEPRLAEVLGEVGRGRDTLAKLASGDVEPDELALALAELELKGLLVRGDAGRYVVGGP